MFNFIILTCTIISISRQFNVRAQKTKNKWNELSSYLDINKRENNENYEKFLNNLYSRKNLKLLPLPAVKISPQKNLKPLPVSSIVHVPRAGVNTPKAESLVEEKQNKLKNTLQWLYQAQAAEKWEEEAIERTKKVADEARDALEKATDEVRMKSADLQRAREHANAAANTAHTAIASLSAHDQLMNRARQIINGLTAQLVAIQRELLVAQQNYIFNGTDQPPVSEEGNSLYLPPIKTATDYRSNLFDNSYLNIDNDLSRSIMQPVENNFVLPAFKETNFNLEQLQNIAGEHSEPLIVLNPTNNNLPRSYIPGNSDLYWLSQYRAPKGWYF